MKSQDTAMPEPTSASDEDGYGNQRQRHVTEFGAILPEYMGRIQWSAERLRSERLHALRTLLTTAAERSPWHRARLRGFDLERLSDADIQHLPVMTKTDLMENFDEIVTDPRLSRELCERHLEEHGDYLLDEYQVVASGGSSGQRGVFVYGWEAWAICYASNVRFATREWASDPALRGVPRVIGVVAASSSTHISAALSRTFSTGPSARHLFPVTRPLAEIVAGLNALQPTVLMGYSSFLPRLTLEARAGRLQIAPRRVIAISEPLLPEVRRALEDTWGVPIANGYAMSEGIFTGFCGFGIHLPDDLCLFEPVADTGHPCARGAASQRVYVTNLYNFTLPLIRFEVTDEVTVLGEDCPCGSHMRLIADPLGRVDDTFVYPGDVTVHPHVFRSGLGAHPEIVEYEVRQTLGGADITVTSDGEIDALAVSREIEDSLRPFVATPEVRITVVSSITRQSSGKLKRFVPRVT